MSILTITSTNPRLSWILQKNPETQATSKEPFAKDLRKGRVYGWFTNKEGTQFRLFFRDHVTEVSFGTSGKEQQFEYLDKSRYCGPLVPASMIDTMLKTAASTEHEDDKPEFETKVEFFGIVRRNIERAMKAFEELKVEVEQFNFFSKVTVTGNSVLECLAATQLISTLCALTEPDFFVQTKKANVIKYLKVLDRCNAGYMLRHILALKMITSDSLFEEVRPLLEKPLMKFKFGNSQKQRQRAIFEALNIPGRADTLIDIGCGELFHEQKLAELYSSFLCFDSDEAVVQQAKTKAAKKNLNSVTIHHQEITAEWVEQNSLLLDGCDVLLTEVLEHMEFSDAMKLFEALLKSSARRIVITLPCRDFNHNYGLSKEEFRHPDHKWEATMPMWGQYCNNGELLKNRSSTTGFVGDMVNYIGSTILTVISAPVASEPQTAPKLIPVHTASGVHYSPESF